MSALDDSKRQFDETMRAADAKIVQLAKAIGAARAIIVISKLPPSATVAECIAAIDDSIEEICQ